MVVAKWPLPSKQAYTHTCSAVTLVWVSPILLPMSKISSKLAGVDDNTHNVAKH